MTSTPRLPDLESPGAQAILLNVALALTAGQFLTDYADDPDLTETITILPDGPAKMTLERVAELGPDFYTRRLIELGQLLTGETMARFALETAPLLRDDETGEAL